MEKGEHRHNQASALVVRRTAVYSIYIIYLVIRLCDRNEVRQRLLDFEIVGGNVSMRYLLANAAHYVRSDGAAVLLLYRYCCVYRGCAVSSKSRGNGTFGSSSCPPAYNLLDLRIRVFTRHTRTHRPWLPQKEGLDARLLLIRGCRTVRLPLVRGCHVQ